MPLFGGRIGYRRSVHDIATSTSSLSKHDIAGIVLVVAAVAVVVFGIVRMMAKAAMAFLLLLLGVAGIIVAILLFTRTI